MKVCIWSCGQCVGRSFEGWLILRSLQRKEGLPDPHSSLTFAILPSCPLQKQTHRSMLRRLWKWSADLTSTTTLALHFGTQIGKPSACITECLQQCASSFPRSRIKGSKRLQCVLVRKVYIRECGRSSLAKSGSLYSAVFNNVHHNIFVQFKIRG